MKKELNFYFSAMKNSTNKGEINTFKKKIKYIFRNLIFYKYSKKLANFILNDKFLKENIYKYPALCSKIHRPYLANSIKLEDKVNIIISSYIFLNNYFKDSFLAELYEKGIYKICEIEGKNEEQLFFYLKVYTDFEKEGEFNLICTDKSGNQLVKLTFAVDNNKIVIAGLQGMKKDENLEKIKYVTKNFYGIFPKKITLEVLYLLFSNFQKKAVSNNGHVYLSLRYKFKKYRKINVDYDEFWESLGAKKENETFWLLPEKLTRKSIEDIPSKKRSQYTNRYKILDELKDKVDSFLLTYKK